MTNTLRILAWNANGLLQHKEHLLVALIEHKIDVCLISETHFTRESYLKLRGYEVYHTVHPSNCAKGGSAVIVKTGLSHYEDVKIEKVEFQVTSVTLKTSAGTITVAAIYSPTRHNLKRGDYLSLLRRFPGNFIIGGDFNSKQTSWGSRLTNTKGNELFQAIQEYRCDVHTTGKTTYWSTDLNKLSDFIDFFVSKNLSPGSLDVTEDFDLESDHSPIVLTFSATLIKKSRNPTLSNHYTDWDLFQTELLTRINLRVAFTTSDELEEELQKFVSDIQHAAWEATPRLPFKVKGNSYPLEVRDRIAVKRKLRTLWQMTRDPRLKTQLNRITQDLRRTILGLKRQSIADYLQDLTDDDKTDYSLWKVTKRLKRPINSIPPLRKQDRT
jgi:exonuclease III